MNGIRKMSGQNEYFHAAYYKQKTCVKDEILRKIQKKSHQF